jgi:hypothetical protein|tara:strand:+ start:276 stop:479 length:204 start_codon:yes stop_codon:yes gene_type:complete
MQNIISEILKEIDNEVIQIQKSLGDGNCEDYARYRQSVGSIVGLNHARIIIKNVYNRMINGDEDADD